MTLRPVTTSVVAHLARFLLAAFLAFAGTAHLTFARTEFQAQVPSWFPASPDLVVVVSGVIELALALALLGPRRWRPAIGWVVGAFFVAVFPGNIAQWAERRDGFGLDTDAARATRLAFQPLLIAWVLWCTGAWRSWREGRGEGRSHVGPRTSRG